MVSAYQSQMGITLGQIKVDEKSNEITAIPKLLDSLDVKGCVITMDAMGCQKNIVEKIVEKKAKYVIAVKENQKGLHEGIKETIMLCEPTCQYKDIECDHGRVEERICRVYHDLTAIPGSWHWAGLNAVIELMCKRFDKTTQTETTCTRYFITSIAGRKAAVIANAIRNHWSIENNLHWALDVTLGEDRSRIRRCNAAENFSRMRKVVLFLLKQDRKRPGCDIPIERKRKRAARVDAHLERILLAPPPVETI